MAYLYRYLTLALFLVSAFFNDAQAFTQQNLYNEHSHRELGYFSTPQGICTALEPIAKAVYPTAVSSTSSINYTGRPSTCYIDVTYIDANNNPAHALGGFSIYTDNGCPANSTDDNNGGCTCNSPTVYNATTGSCEAPQPTCSAGSMDGYSTTGSHNVGPNMVDSACVDGCVMGVKSDFCYRPSPDVPYNCIGKYTGQTGASCTGTTETPVPTPTPSPDPDQPKKDCISKGGSYGTINGFLTCVPRATPGAAQVQTPSTSSSSTTSGGNTTNITNNTQTITNTDGSVTTITNTTTSVNGGTPTTQTKTETQPASDFCKDNPTSKICKDVQSSFGGACGAFTCDGDAIQCAIAKKIHQNKCDDLKDIDDAKTEIQGKAAYTTGQKLMNNDYDQDVKDFMNKTGDNQRTVDIPSSLSESGNASFGGDGFQDYHGTVLGQSFTVPFSSSNTYFNYFGYVLLALTYLAAYKYIASVV